MKDKFENSDEAVTALIESCKNHANATETGDYKTANKSYAILKKAVTDLEENNATYKLKNLLTDENESVKIWVASFLIKQDDVAAHAVLEELLLSKNPHISFSARLVLEGWKKKSP